MKHATLSFRIWLRAELLYLLVTLPLAFALPEIYLISSALAIVFGLLNLVIFILAMCIQEMNVSPAPRRAMAAVYTCAVVANLPGLILACLQFREVLAVMWPLPLLALAAGAVSVATHRRALYKYFYGVLSHSL